MMNTMRLVLGWIMIAIGAYLVGHLVWTGGAPQTPSLWLDIGFAALFILRGTMNLRGRRRYTSGS
jgi:hypothetical protein